MLRTPTSLLLALVASAALCGTASAASTTVPDTTVPATTGPVTKATLDSFESPAKAKTWEKPGGYQNTQTFCESFRLGRVKPGVCGNSVTGKATLRTNTSYIGTVTGLVAVYKVDPAVGCGTGVPMPDGT